MNHIMDVEVSPIDPGRIRIKFVAFIGEVGPELVMPISMARELLAKLEECFLQPKSITNESAWRSREGTFDDEPSQNR